MLHVGLDLSRERVDVCLVSDQGELIDQFPAPADRDGLYGLTRRVAVYDQRVRGDARRDSRRQRPLLRPGGMEQPTDERASVRRRRHYVSRSATTYWESPQLLLDDSERTARRTANRNDRDVANAIAHVARPKPMKAITPTLGGGARTASYTSISSRLLGRSLRPMATDCLETQEAFVGPKPARVVVDVKCRRSVWEGDPTDL